MMRWAAARQAPPGFEPDDRNSGNAKTRPALADADLGRHRRPGPYRIRPTNAGRRHDGTNLGDARTGIGQSSVDKPIFCG